MRFTPPTGNPAKESAPFFFDEGEKDFHVLKSRFLNELKTLLAASETDRDASMILFSFYAMLLTNPILAHVISSEDIYVVIRSREHEGVIGFDLQLVDKKLKCDLFEVSLRLGHYGTSFWFLNGQLLELEKLSDEESLSRLQKPDDVGMNWFSKTLSLGHSVYSAMKDMKLDSSPEYKKYRGLLRLVRESFIRVLRKYCHDTKNEHELLSREILYMTRGEVLVCPIKIIHDATTLSIVREGVSSLIEGEPALDAAFGDDFKAPWGEALSLNKKAHVFVSLRSAESLSEFVSHSVENKDYLAAFVDVFKRALSLVDQESILFMLNAVGPVHFDKIFLEGSDLFEHVLKMVCADSKKKTVTPSSAARVAKSTPSVETVFDKMLSLKGGSEEQVKFLVGRYVRHEELSEESNRLFENLNQFFYGLFEFLNLGSLSGLTSKAVDSVLSPEKIKSILKELSHRKNNPELIAKNFWRAYLYFQGCADAKEEFRSLVYALEKIVGQLAVSEKEFGDLSKAVFKALLESNYFSSLRIKYALKALSGEARAEADKIASSEAERIGDSLSSDPGSLVSSRYSTKWFYPKLMLDRVMAEIERELARPHAIDARLNFSIYARLSYLLDLVVWIDNQPKLKSVGMPSLLLNYLFRRSVIAMQLIDLDASDDLLVSVSKWTADNERLDSDVWLTRISLDETSATELLLLYLFTEKLSLNDLSYQPISLLIKRVLRACAFVYLNTPERVPSFGILLDLAAKYRFFEQADDCELKMILLDGVLAKPVDKPVKVLASNEGSDSESEAAAGAGNEALVAKKRKNKKKKPARSSAAVGATHATILVKVPEPEEDKDSIASVLDSGSSASDAAPSILSSKLSMDDASSRGSERVSSVSPDSHSITESIVTIDHLSLFSGAASIAVLVPEARTVSDERISALQALRGKVSRHLDELMTELQVRLTRSLHGSLERALLDAVLIRLKSNDELLNLVRNSLKKIKGGKRVASFREDPAPLPMVSDDIEIATWAKPYIDPCLEAIELMTTLLKTLALEKHAELSAENIEFLMEKLRAVHLPIVSPSLDEKLNVFARIHEVDEKLSALINDFSLFSANYLAYFQSQPSARVRQEIFKDLTNLWSLMHTVNHWRKEVYSVGFERKCGFAKYELDLPKPDVAAPEGGDLKFSSEMAGYVARYNGLVNDFALSLPAAASSVGFGKALFRENISNLLLHLKSAYFLIYHVPVVEQLVALLGPFAKCSAPGTQLTMEDPLDHDLQLQWRCEADNKDEVIRRLREILIGNGFKVLSAERVGFFGSDIISVKIDAKDHLPIDLTVYYGSAIHVTQHCVAHAAASLDPITGYLSCDHPYFHAILHKRFLLHEPPLSGSDKKDLNNMKHILKLLVRAWYKACRGEMVLGEEANELLARLARPAGDLAELKRAEALLENALVSLVREHFSNYRLGLAYRRRSLMLLEFCQHLGFSIVAEPAGTKQYHYLLDVDLKFGSFDFSIMNVSYDSKRSILFELGAYFFESNKAALERRAVSVGAVALLKSSGIFSVAPAAIDPASGVALATKEFHFS